MTSQRADHRQARVPSVAPAPAAAERSREQRPSMNATHPRPSGVAVAIV